MSRPLQENYRCPDCRGALAHENDGMFCRSCGVLFPLEDGRLNFLPDESNEESTRLIEPLFEVVAPFYQSLYFPLLYRLGTLPNPHSPEAEAQNLARRTGADLDAVLDVACGTGLLTRKLAQEHRTVHGLDLSRGMLRQAHRRTPPALQERIDYARGDAERLPFGEAFFDAVTCSGAFYFFPELRKVLNEIHRVLQPDGRLAGMTVVREGPLGFRLSEHLLSLYQSIGTYRVYEQSEFLRALGDAGFKDVDREVHGCVLLFDARRR